MPFHLLRLWTWPPLAWLVLVLHGLVLLSKKSHRVTASIWIMPPATWFALSPTVPHCGLYWSPPVGGPLAGVTGAGVKLSSGKIFSIRVAAQSLASLGSILWNCSAGRNGLISAILHWPILHADKNSKAFDHIGESCWQSSTLSWTIFASRSSCHIPSTAGLAPFSWWCFWRQ